jgi:hypothetical protein
VIRSQLRKIIPILKRPYLKKTCTKIMPVEWLKVKSLSSSPSTSKQKKKRKKERKKED